MKLFCVSLAVLSLAAGCGVGWYFARAQTVTEEPVVIRSFDIYTRCVELSVSTDLMLKCKGCFVNPQGQVIVPISLSPDPQHPDRIIARLKNLVPQFSSGDSALAEQENRQTWLQIGHKTPWTIDAVDLCNRTNLAYR